MHSERLLQIWLEFSNVFQIPWSKQTLYTFPALPKSKQRFRPKGQGTNFIFQT